MSNKFAISFVCLFLLWFVYKQGHARDGTDGGGGASLKWSFVCVAIIGWTGRQWGTWKEGVQCVVIRRRGRDGMGQHIERNLSLISGTSTTDLLLLFLKGWEQAGDDQLYEYGVKSNWSFIIRSRIVIWPTFCEDMSLESVYYYHQRPSWGLLFEGVNLGSVESINYTMVQ